MTAGRVTVMLLLLAGCGGSTDPALPAGRPAHAARAAFTASVGRRLALRMPADWHVYHQLTSLTRPTRRDALRRAGSLRPARPFIALPTGWHAAPPDPLLADAWHQIASFPLRPSRGGPDPIKSMGPRDVLVTAINTAKPLSGRLPLTTISFVRSSRRALVPRGHALADVVLPGRGGRLNITVDVGARCVPRDRLRQVNRALSSIAR